MHSIRNDNKIINKMLYKQNKNKKKNIQEK